MWSTGATRATQQSRCSTSPTLARRQEQRRRRIVTRTTRPRFRDLRLLNPVACINLEALAEYVRRWFSEDDAKLVFDRIEDLIKRSETVSMAFETWLQKQKAAEGSESEEDAAG